MYGMRLAKILTAVLLALFLAACSTLSGGSRAAPSTGACIHAVVRDLQQEDWPDKQMHCVASGLIAFHCSVTEAYLAGVGKEVKDVFGRGNAEWADLRADRKGIACSRAAINDAQIYTCCQQSAGVLP